MGFWEEKRGEGENDLGWTFPTPNRFSKQNNELWENKPFNPIPTIRLIFMWSPITAPSFEVFRA